ncbi:FMN-binding protein [Clostridium carboxidivorans P7]|uniref:FMN-binding domain protein n=1 Tax=Clostridium carboxidivorans P7 TaxID=536227 RepID=C6PPX4_9CLOT|nr:FMN-binding protein [Clostridium carboxidivorans]AKN31106.1 FMN-binding protein [Clostridium carboxidivorans P7]EET88715.1 FMN-binding domain protein [Clostridium carboxidivorans P7]EFG88625.1 FMN-binding domain protein [Clostridium carboxidivorans P7]
MKKKISKLQILRTIVQIICLIVLPGLFTLSFSEIGKLYSMIIKGNFNLVQALPGLTAAIAVVPITILFGRFFCGWMCAFGTFNDFIYMAFQKVFKKQFRVNKQVDSILKYVKYAILALIVCFVWTMGNSTLNDYSPWNAFAQIGNFPDAIFQYTFGFMLLILIAVGAMFIERFFCRYLCPLGAIFSIVSKIRIFKIKKPNDKCGKCRLCTNNCSMGIELYKVNKVNSGECINCLKCIDVCPRKNTQASVANQEINPAFASAVAIAAFTGLYAASFALGGSVKSNMAVGTNTSNSTTISASNNVNNSSQAQYKDGTYTGVGNGFRPDLKVSVTVKNGKISDIQILSHNESRGYYEEPFNVVPKEIIETQSTKVDAVSGATRSSNGIMQAVENALSGAKVNSNSTNTNKSTDNSSSNSENVESNSTNESQNSSSTSNSTSTSSTKGEYKDGTYTGVGRGFRPNLKVSVTVSGGKISNIEIVSHNESRGYYEQPFDIVPKEIIQSQSTNVDTVSGATRSSNGIMSAVEDALSQAK